MLKKTLTSVCCFLGLVLLSGSVFAQKYVYKFDTDQKWWGSFFQDTPTFQGYLPPTCTISAYDGTFSYTMTCDKPLQGADQIVVFQGFSKQHNFYTLSCDTGAPNSGAFIKIPTACPLCVPVEPTAPPCPPH